MTTWKYLVGGAVGILTGIGITKIGTNEKDVYRGALSGLVDCEKNIKRNLQHLSGIYREVLENIAAVDPKDPNATEYVKAMTDTLQIIEELMVDYRQELQRLSRAYA